MAIIRVTKKHVQEAFEARIDALKKDPEYREFDEEQNALMKEATEQGDREDES